MHVTRNHHETNLREEICTVAESLYLRGYATGTAGNISARLEEGWLITPTDCCLGRIDPAEIVKVNANGEATDDQRPSKTLALHRGIYQNNVVAHGVIHTHATSLVQLSLSGAWSSEDVLPPITPYQLMKVGHVPLIRYRAPGDGAAALEIAQLARSVRAVLLERIGPVVWERSVKHASYVLEELEETARLWLQCQPKPMHLGDQEITELRDRFGALW
jgi:ribulose-5-phosphate 4-epimerase/fuculose-1-phosphate aldolase